MLFNKTFRFAFILCLVASFLLTFAATSLRPLQDENKRIDRQKNVLKALGLLDTTKKYTMSEIDQLFSASVQNRYVSQDGRLIDSQKEGSHPVYVYVQDARIQAYVMPISGYGLWSTLYGYLALEGDGDTVRGITFYEHGETPGLGGECEAEWFQKNYVGKKITDANGQFVSVDIVKGKVKDVIRPEKRSNYVDGISGATITSRGINVFLRADLAKYEALSKRLRDGEQVL